MTLARRITQAVGLYDYLRYSSLYPLYQFVFKRDAVRSFRNGVAFYRIFLGDLKPGELVFDVGANSGAMTQIFLRLGARVLAVEPDKANLRHLRLTFRKNKKVLIEDKAVSDRSEKVSFHCLENGSAYNSLERKWADANSFSQHKKVETYEVETTTLDRLILQYGRPGYIKLDIEGHEKKALDGLTHAVPILTFEANLSVFRDESVDCVRRLSSLSEAYRFRILDDASHQKYGWMNAEQCEQFLKQTSLTYCEILVRREQIFEGERELT